MDERAVTFGPGGHLVGILCRPQGPARPVGVLLLNAGVIHRIGPHRLNVKLARSLAAQGFTSLRFDRSGVGDSRTPRDALPQAEQAVRDLQAAMDELYRTYGLRDFFVFGICSGAMNAYATALVDERVRGLFMIDGYIYPTLKAKWVRLARRVAWLGPVQAARRLMALAVQKLTPRVGPDGSETTETAGAVPQKAVFAAHLDQLTSRGVEVAVLFSGTMFAEYSYREQFADCFAGYAFLDRVQVFFEPELDHTATALQAQRHLIGLFMDWLQKHSASADTRREAVR